MSSYEREKIHNDTFVKWFKTHVAEMEKSNSCKDIHKDISPLAAGPSKWARSFAGYTINGLRFHTKQREMRRKTQNSGVFLNATTSSFSSSKDKNPISGDVSFYGVLNDIIELRYTNELKFVLFKCDWVDFSTGLKYDEFNFTLVNFNHLLYKQNKNTDEPFILASQAQQAWYIQDPVDPNWHVALKMTPRDLFNVDPEVNVMEGSEDDYYVGHQGSIEDNDVDYTSWVRKDVEGLTVNSSGIMVQGSNLIIDRIGVNDPGNDDATSDEDDGTEQSSSDSFDDPSDEDDFFDEFIPSHDDNED